MNELRKTEGVMSMTASDPTFVQNIDDVFSLGEMTADDTATLEEIGVESSDPTQDDENETSAATAGALLVQPVVPINPPIVPFANRPVSGRYRGTVGGVQLELRVDVDRTRPMRRASADFYQVSGGTTTYYGSFVVNSPTVTVTATAVTVKGLGSFTFSAGAPVV